MTNTVDPIPAWHSRILERNNVTVRGQGPRVMLFAHGLGCDQTMWRLMAPHFEAQYRTVLFDYVGSGPRELVNFDRRRYSTLEGYAQDVLEVCAALDLHDVILVGHSVSSMIGLLASIREPGRFSRLIMVCPSPHYLNDPPRYHGGFERADIDNLLQLMEHNYIGWAASFSPTVMGNAERPELRIELEESFCTTHPEAAQVFARTTFLSDSRDDLHKLTIPALILQSRDDSIVPASVGPYLHEHLTGSCLTVLDTAGHCPHLSDPAAVIQAVEAFLSLPSA